MKKMRLVVEYEYEFELLGIITSVKFYKLAWAINQKLGIRLVKQADYTLEVKGGGTAAFGNYLFESDYSYFELYKNRAMEGENAYLVPEFQHFDYLVKIDAQSQSFAKEEILKELKEVSWIEYIAAIEVKKLKSKDNFLT